MQTKWVEFVGGPLHGQCRNIPIAATEWNAALPIPGHATFENLNDPCREVGHVTYKIETVCSGRPGTLGYREAFKGILK